MIFKAVEFSDEVLKYKSYDFLDMEKGVTREKAVKIIYNILSKEAYTNGANIYAITYIHSISNEYIKNKEKLEKIKAGYDLYMIVTVRDNINGEVIEKKFITTKKLTFKGIIKVVR